MKKLILTITAVIGLLSAPTALAATNLILSPANISVKAGQTFTVVITVDPQGVKNSTIKTELDFPAGLLEVRSFAFGGGGSWVALKQPGYDLTDNTNGKLIKTAGYPGGVTTPTIFGTVTFAAKKSGSGAIRTTINSLALNDQSQNVLSGTGQTNVTVAAALVAQVSSRTPTPRPVAVVKTPTTSVSPSPTPTTTTEPSPSETPAESPISDGGGLLATIGTVASLGTDSKPLAVIVIIAVLAFLYWLIRKLFFRKAPTV